MNKGQKHSCKRIQDLFQNSDIKIEVIEFKELMRTSKEIADRIGCEVGQIAKTLIFKSKKTKKPICVILSGKNRLDESKIIKHLGQEIEKPDANFIAEHTKFIIGGIPPVGYPLDNKPLIDEDLMAYKEIWAAAGTPYAVFRIAPQDLVEITEAQIVTIRQ
jgi:prolyl-tRNA editing enzyme YbaK/EbsC (Cys-tRNA(Pro) deacylase)